MKLKKTISIKSIDIVIIIILLIFIITFILIKRFSYKSNRILLNYAESESTNLATILINKAIYEISFNDNYEKLLNIEKNENDEIISVNINDKESNKLAYVVTTSILNNIELLKNGDLKDLNLKYLDNSDLIYKVPIGVIYDIPILMDITPKIPFKITLLSNINTDIISNIKDYGINNSLIEIFIKIKLNVQIILPFNSQNYEVVKQIPIESRIIQGKIPQYYGGVITSSLKDY